MTKVLLNKFNRGTSPDPRTTASGFCRASSNVDMFSQSFKLTPHFATESGDNASATSQKQNFQIALRTGSTYSLYALGVKSGASTAEVLYKDLTDSSTTDLTDALWGAPANNQSSTGAVNFELFTYYQKQGLIYGMRAFRYVWAFSPTGTAWADTAYDYGSTATSISNGIVHSKDDIMYFGVDNKVIKNNAGSFSVGITLPTHLKVVSICEYKNYLAIACTVKSGQPLHSIVYLWDRDSTLETLSESYQWGNEGIFFIEELDGFLISASGQVGTDSSISDYVAFKYLTSGGPQEFTRFDVGASSILPSMTRKANGRVYFQWYVSIDGTQRNGLWSIARTSDGFGIAQEYTPNNTTALTSGQPKGFFLVGDYVFQSYLDNSAYVLSKTKEDGTYTTAVYETTVNPAMELGDRFDKKQLTWVRISYEKLGSGDTVLLYYKADGGSWTQILSASTADSFYLESNTDVNKSNFTEATEYEFKIETTGGAVVTALEYDYKVIKTLR